MNEAHGAGAQGTSRDRSARRAGGGIGWRLLGYARMFKWQILTALAMLSVAVAADLTGPLIAKAMIDRHIVGIQTVWYEVGGPGPDRVFFRGRWYERSAYLPPAARHGRVVHLAEAGRGFYLIAGRWPAGPAGAVTVHPLGQSAVVVEAGGRKVRLPAVRLSARELFRFYQPEIPRLWRLAGVYLALIAVSAGLTYGQQLGLQVAANRILQTMRMQVYRQIHRLPVRYFDETPAGKMVSRITNDTEAIRDFYVTVLANVIASGINMAGIYVALFLLDVRLALVCCLLLPMLLVWVWLYRRYAGRVNQRIRALLAEINGMIHETIQCMPVIHAFNRERRTLAEFEELNQAYFQGQTRLLVINSLTGYNLSWTLRNLFFVALIAYFGWRYLRLPGGISYGTLYAFVDYLGRLFQPVVQVVNQLSNLEQARASAERVFALLDMPGEDVADGSMPRIRGDVEFEDVWFSYDGKDDVLRGISFSVRQGQTVAIVGHTGSGKSSIMNLLFRFYEPRSGRIRVDGMDIRDIPAQHLRRHMAIVLQDPFLFTGTIASNVSLDDPAISRERVDWALREVGADRLLAGLPNGWDEPVVERGSTLSAGQRQLISFARALAFDPAILVLDEATASIDTETEAAIQRALEVLKRGRTTFIIAHRLATIRHADMILVLERGRIVERGTHDELMARRGRYYQMYRLQLGDASSA
ncbi:multidrug ABC transporter permease [Alicyclobacillus cellulosilyticus]|uniref:Multidrug ABC transporter permease n=1 Tax=Alicyclobacillus cellulosilyticus TaxID=1003997 RepID=A0A917NGH9_9BACL|nr:ABC transporter ATP-binding protein [Alicyclobacillus cellulosilyticus]GGI99385.1 multidrug ABC transporter permease [Alicyclobacillus cellulosilyticus]